MLNKVVAECLQLMPEEVQFWQIGAYAELEVKGNMFSGRQLMLQGLRQNEDFPKFNLAYLKFELVTFEKIMKRRDVLNKISEDQAIDFVDQEEQESPEGEMKKGEEANLLKIVYAQVATRFSADALTLREAKRMLRDCKYLADSELVKTARLNY